LGPVPAFDPRRLNGPKGPILDVYDDDDDEEEDKTLY